MPPTATLVNKDAEAILQSYIFTYHKTGTVLFERILQRLATATQKSFAIRYGRFDQPDPAIDITLFAHSLIRFDPFRYDMRAIRVVRDPRDIWVSGFSLSSPLRRRLVRQHRFQRGLANWLSTGRFFGHPQARALEAGLSEVARWKILSTEPVGP